MSLDGVAGAQTETANLTRRNVYVVRSRQIVDSGERKNPKPSDRTSTTPSPMISTSWVASCLRIANISSCLRMVLAFSTWCSSANATSSAGVLDLRSWSFISRIGGLRPWKIYRRRLENKKLAPSDLGERSQVWGDEVGSREGPEPDAATGPNIREPERDCIRLRSVGYHQ